jgi:hypothetical protein
MTKRNSLLIGFVLTMFSSFLITSCDEDKETAKSIQPASLSYHEEFDSMQRVIDMGWKGVNLSDPIGSQSWQQGSYIVNVLNGTKGGPFESRIASHSYKASANEHAYVNYFAGEDLSFINCWLITPELSMKNGDKISFWTTTADPVSFPDRMQVWLNPTNNSYNVGRTAAETGDFTVKLLDINQTLSALPYPDGYPTTWTKFELTISGLPNGTIPQKHRIGFRYYVKDGGPGGSVSDEIGIDDFDFISQ